MSRLIEDIERLRGLGSIPVEYSALRLLYRDYASPASKVAELCKQGLLLRIQKGWYLVSEVVSNQRPNANLIANHLYGPSYVSLESALQEYGLIPEAVYSTESVTARRSKQYATQLGAFHYHRVPSNYYSIGVTRQKTQAGYNYLIASPEKALCDHFVKTGGVQVRSRKAMLEYLDGSLRIDTSRLATFDPGIIEAAAAAGSKQKTLCYLKEAVEWLS
ncbi:MAG: hypothetical protein FWE41_05605 [Coriobacteriia bacterium]|nr:hypothetical protein [Coriobacteriia bacterium]MCL2749435.1 hypothetical protein [Coriobacteriia bacterium]